MGDTIFGIIFTFMVGGLVLFLIVIGIGVSNGFKLDDQYASGQITLQQYCDNFATYRQIPAACYSYFSVKPQGQDCAMVGKVYTCHPHLVPQQ